MNMRMTLAIVLILLFVLIAASTICCFIFLLKKRRKAIDSLMNFSDFIEKMISEGSFESFYRKNSTTTDISPQPFVANNGMAISNGHIQSGSPTVLRKSVNSHSRQSVSGDASPCQAKKDPPCDAPSPTVFSNPLFESPPDSSRQCSNDQDLLQNANSFVTSGSGNSCGDYWRRVENSSESGRSVSNEGSKELFPALQPPGKTVNMPLTLNPKLAPQVELPNLLMSSETTFNVPLTSVTTSKPSFELTNLPQPPKPMVNSAKSEPQFELSQLIGQFLKGDTKTSSGQDSLADNELSQVESSSHDEGSDKSPVPSVNSDYCHVARDGRNVPDKQQPSNDGQAYCNPNKALLAGFPAAGYSSLPIVKGVGSNLTSIESNAEITQADDLANRESATEDCQDDTMLEYAQFMDKVIPRKTNTSQKDSKENNGGNPKVVACPKPTNYIPIGIERRISGDSGVASPGVCLTQEGPTFPAPFHSRSTAASRGTPAISPNVMESINERNSSGDGEINPFEFIPGQTGCGSQGSRLPDQSSSQTDVLRQNNDYCILVPFKSHC